MTFAPSTRRIYVRSVRMAIGLQVIVPPHPPRSRLLCGSCSSGQSFAFSFLPAAPRETTLAVQLGVPSHQGPQGTLTPKSLPDRLSPHGSFARLHGGPRHAWRTRSPRLPRRRGARGSGDSIWRQDSGRDREAAGPATSRAWGFLGTKLLTTFHLLVRKQHSRPPRGRSAVRHTPRLEWRCM